jgi:predicted metal-binding protein
MVNILYKSSTGNIYPLELGWVSVPINKVLFDKKLTEKACLNGCKLYNRNGGCPPFAMDFGQIKNSYENITFIYSKLVTKDYPIKILNGNYYVRWSFVEALLTPFMNRFEKIIHIKEHRLFLSSGFCKKCGNKRCAVKTGKECRNPLERTFSLEATGVLVTKVAEEFLGFRLYWWDKKEMKYLPPYMTKIVAVIGNQEINNSEIFSILDTARAEGKIISSRG